MNSLVSIIVPNYNHSNFLKQRLHSIYNQTYQNIEVILLDDASTDNSLNILKSYQNHEKTAHLIINNTNGGNPFKQWQKGIKLAKGDLIWIAESDDFSSLDFLNKVVQPFFEDKKIGLSYCQSIIIDENNNELYNNINWTNDLEEKRWSTDYINDGKNECITYLLYKNTIPNASATVFKKSLISSYPTEFKILGDWYFWISILLETKISFCAQPLNFFRKHNLTTREHNTPAKKKLRINEGFKIILFIKPHISISQFNERIKHHYRWYLRTLSLKKLIYHFFYPYNSFAIKLNYSMLVSLSIKEFIYRLKHKINHA